MTELEELPLETLRLIDGPCRVFEEKLAAGANPRIEEELAAVPGSVREALLIELLYLEWELLDPPDHAPWLARFPEWRRAVHDAWTRRHPPDPNAPPDFGPDLRPEERVGRGGMGEVWRVRDARLDRDLAAKFAVHEPTGRAAAAIRAEARLTGALQHPNVPPVHSEGELADGRPYFTMRLIAGRTLAELLADRPAPDADLPRFLRVMEQMCDAVAFAHSRGMVHRDLKPRNVMVGAFGEVQVMDWGLARESGDLSAPPGLVAGTYAYMPPECAAGRADGRDPRADVFCLGGVLCEILTGEPPHGGQRPDANDPSARSAELRATHERLERAKAADPLKRLARACLDADPAARPNDAGIVARRLGDYQRTAVAEREQARLEAERRRVEEAERRKRRRWQIGTAIAAALLVTAGLVALLERRHRLMLDDVRAAAARIEAGSELEEADAQLRRGQDVAADAALRAAEIRLAAHPDAELGRLAGKLRREAELSRRLAAVLDDRMAFSDRHYSGPPLLAAYRAAFAAHGIDPNERTPAEVAETLIGRPVHARAIAALDDWALLAHEQNRPELRNRLLAAARAADPAHSLGDRIRDPAMWTDPARARRIAEEVDVATAPPPLLLLVAEAIPQDEAVALLGRAVQVRPGEFAVQHALGTLYRLRKDPRAIPLLETARALRPESPRAARELGIAFEAAGDFAMAERLFRHAIELDPEYAAAHVNLGANFIRQHRFEEGIASIRHARRLAPDLAGPQDFLGWAYTLSGNLPAAIVEYRDLLTRHPTHPTGREAIVRLLIRAGAFSSGHEVPAEP